MTPPPIRAARSRRWLAAAGLLVSLPVLGVGGLGLNAAMTPSRQIQVPPAHVEVDVQTAARNLADALTLPTVVKQGSVVDPVPFDHLRGLLEQRFPRVHAELIQEVHAEHSLLYTWPGTEPELPPVVLMGHLDVVPAEPDGWTVPPFSGRIQDGFIWGRGALDDKQNVLGQLEAVELLLGQGFTPRRTVHLAYGHDEEVGGQGAAALSRSILREGQAPFIVLDEGGLIVTGGLAGVPRPVALIGVAEKGYVTVELVARDAGGHASMPPPRTASGRIAAAVTRVEANPMPAGLRGAAGQMLDWVAPEATWPMKAVYGNHRVLGPLITAQMTGKPATNALLRTTGAVTMLSGSPKENVLPDEARAMINFRILPGDSVEDVLAHVRRVVDDPEVVVRAAGDIESEPSPISTVEGPAFEVLQRAIGEVFPEAVVSPYLMVGATDARYYAAHSPHVYRFTPAVASLQDVSRIHGYDERIGVEDYGRLIAFYVRFLHQAAEAGSGPAAGG